MPSRSPRHGSVLSRTLFALGVAFLVTAIPGTAAAQTAYFFPDGETFDPGIPSPEAFLGYPIGDFHTRHDRIVAYMEELSRLSDRAAYQVIGCTYEHRPMPVLTVTTPENHARLEEIREEHLASLDPENPVSVDGDRPAIVHLGYGVHGYETPPAEASSEGNGANHSRTTAWGSTVTARRLLTADPS